MKALIIMLLLTACAQPKPAKKVEGGFLAWENAPPIILPPAEPAVAEEPPQPPTVLTPVSFVDDTQFPELFILESEVPDMPTSYGLSSSIDFYYEPAANAYYYAKVSATNGLAISLSDAQEERLFLDYDLKDKLTLQYVGSLDYLTRLYVHKTTGEQFVKYLSPIVDTHYIGRVAKDGIIYGTNIMLTEPVYPVLKQDYDESPYGPLVMRVFYTNAQSLNLGEFAEVAEFVRHSSLTYTDELGKVTNTTYGELAVRQIR